MLPHAPSLTIHRQLFLLSDLNPGLEEHEFETLFDFEQWMDTLDFCYAVQTSHRHRKSASNNTANGGVEASEEAGEEHAVDATSEGRGVQGSTRDGDETGEQENTNGEQEDAIARTIFYTCSHDARRRKHTNCPRPPSTSGRSQKENIGSLKTIDCDSRINATVFASGKVKVAGFLQHSHEFDVSIRAFSYPLLL